MDDLLKSEEIIWLLPPTVALIVALLLLTAKKLLWLKLEKWAGRTTSTVDDALVASLKVPVSLFILIAAAWAGLHFAPDEVRSLKGLNFGFKICFILTVVWIIDRVTSVLLSGLALPNGMNEGLRSIVKTVVRGGLIAIGVMVAMDTLGVSITPLLASLGIGSLAVALALQDTLSNFFSGMYLQFEQPIRINDYVKLENGTEGYIRAIGWRSTHVRLTSDNTVIIPNNKLSSSIILNYNVPYSETVMLVEVSVAYDSDLEKVETITTEVGREVMNAKSGGVDNFDPLVRYHTFADSSIQFTVVLRAQHWTSQSLVKHQFIKALHTRFKQENIEIPFPQQVVHKARATLDH